jgi:hypothetical protein
MEGHTLRRMRRNKVGRISRKKDGRDLLRGDEPLLIELKATYPPRERQIAS